MDDTSSEIRWMVLNDPWETHGPIPLNKVLERNQFPPFLTALVALFLAFVLFQLVISPIAIILLLLLEGIPFSEFLDVFSTRLEEFGTTLLIGNTVGQIFGLAIPALLFARMHSTREFAFLRLRWADRNMLLLGLVGLAALLPFVQWLAAINETIPLPEWLQELEQSQMDLIEKILLQGEVNIAFNLVVLALTPAFCEELLFRGYVQRQSERSLGIIGGILFSGFAFGLYHLRISQALPLSTLGIYLAYLAWRTGSLWPPIVAHFANNAFAVFLGAYATSKTDVSASDVETMHMPWYYVVVGLAVFVIVLYGMHRYGQKTQALQYNRPTKVGNESTGEKYE